MSGRNPRFTITVDPDAAARYRAWAKTEKRSVGNLAQIVIEEYIRRREEDRKRQQRRKAERMAARYVGAPESAAERDAASPEGTVEGGQGHA
jgi:hypothetical protein